MLRSGKWLVVVLALSACSLDHGEEAVDDSAMPTAGSHCSFIPPPRQSLKRTALDYIEGGVFDKRRQQISRWLDATNPDLTPFYERGGKMIVVVGANDTMASSGDQMDYFQSVIETMGEVKVNAFARFFVMPQGDHNLQGENY